jgi:hypothetical protein
MTYLSPTASKTDSITEQGHVAAVVADPLARLFESESLLPKGKMQIQGAICLDLPGARAYGTAISLYALGLELLTHGPAPIGARCRVHLEIDSGLVSFEGLIHSTQRNDAGGPMRVELRWARMEPTVRSAILSWVSQRRGAQAIQRVDPGLGRTEHGPVPKRGWIAALRQRITGFQPQIRGPKGPRLRAQVEVDAAGTLILRWERIEDAQADWSEMLSQGQLPVDETWEFAGRVAVEAHWPDGRCFAWQAVPLRAGRLLLSRREDSPA